ncbi:MAG: pyruvate, phosphate dikinase [Deltaproteobacteria bacterium]|nr:pyruvate, phosphate dikinase [Candidatus Anaeroferrophillus wilburensis]MBN2889491.1 pyruvate, phosphate dikinase [Deltaproteobacteria bacterium]
MAEKYVFTFGNGAAEGNSSMKNLLGGKGANLAEMTSIGIPVPSGFTISTEACVHFYQHHNQYPDGLTEQVQDAIAKTEAIMERRFGSPDNPLLFSVRSGARVSMPGMMDTVLNLGLNDDTIKGIIRQSGNERFAYDSYRRFIQMYGNVVLGIDGEKLEELLEEMKEKRGVKQDTELDALDLKELVGLLKERVRELTGSDFPEDPAAQLWGAISAVFKSWETKRAITYRRLNNIPDHWGTAVNVQSMVFGNMGDDCATGVAFTRDPSTGENYFFGEFLVNAQGEDVVAGIRTPQPINNVGKTDQSLPSLEEVMPPLYQELVTIYQKLEQHYHDMQDIEFTIERGKLWLLQTRNGKRTVKAAVKIAVDMVNEGLISKKEAILRIDPQQLDQMLHPTLDPDAPRTQLAKGLPASPGAACGEVVFSADEAEALNAEGKKVILVRIETSPEDIHGMHAAQGILTSRGGMTSHAAVVARGMGKCCVAGCGDVVVNYSGDFFKVGKSVVKKGDIITLDGSTGELFLGTIPTIEPGLTGEFGIFMDWVDETRRLKVRTNADTPHDSAVARNFGAEGIGLCRTEHMFFEEDRIMAVREMILASDLAGREKALAKILPMQKSDFIGIFTAMEGLPVTIRLLDPPLHEFLPHTDHELKELSQSMGIPFETLKQRTAGLHEFNPMLGHRGCRLGISFPEIYLMQVRAIMEAACELVKGPQLSVIPEIMIPLVVDVRELRILKEKIITICDETIGRYGVTLDYLIGTMIELPRAAITADEIAKEAEFFSFGTNDLTQTTYGLSRDDAGKFLKDYLDQGIFAVDPFVSIDIDGVGALVEMGVTKGRTTRPDLKVGICGEHGGEPASVEFCHRTGLNYVSCSPYRVPIARLAAAQAALKE